MNTITYFEIQSSQPEREAKFYSEVFGWTFHKVENLPIDYYHIELSNGIGGGLLKRPAAIPPPACGTNAFTNSIEVKSFDATAEIILKNGGKVALPKFEVSGKYWLGYFLDPDNNVFGVLEVIAN